MILDYKWNELQGADLLAIYVSYITCKSEPLTVGFGNKIREDLEVYGVFLVIKFLEAMREQLWSSKKKKCTESVNRFKS